MPQTAGTFGFNYNSPNFWFVSANLNYYADNYVTLISTEERDQQLT